ncbi:MAG: glycosyltransferase family 2 protein [Leptospirillia bacterium]
MAESRKANRLSLCLITYNEEDNLDDCLSSFAPIADEIVVVDSGSTDRTQEISAKYNARFSIFPFEGFGRQKQRAIDIASGRWIFVVDADERATPSLLAELRSIIEKEGSADGYAVNRVNFFMGRAIRHSGWSPDFVVRLFKNGEGRTSENIVHEEIFVSGKVERLSSPLLHYTYRSIDAYLQKSARYASLSAMEKQRNGHRPGILKILLNPPFVFFKMYVVRQGFRDGREGLFLAILYAFYTAIKYIWMYYPDDSGEPLSRNTLPQELEGRAPPTK